MTLRNALIGSLLLLCFSVTANAKNYALKIPLTSLTVPTGRAFGDSYSFHLGTSTDLDISWTSSNLYLDVLLFKKVENQFISQANSFMASGSFSPIPLSSGSYVLDFLGARQSTGKSSYTFSVL